MLSPLAWQPTGPPAAAACAAAWLQLWLPPAPSAVQLPPPSQPAWLLLQHALQLPSPQPAKTQNQHIFVMLLSVVSLYNRVRVDVGLHASCSCLLPAQPVACTANTLHHRLPAAPHLRATVLQHLGCGCCLGGLLCRLCCCHTRLMRCLLLGSTLGSLPAGHSHHTHAPHNVRVGLLTACCASCLAHTHLAPATTAAYAPLRGRPPTVGSGCYTCLRMQNAHCARCAKTAKPLAHFASCSSRRSMLRPPAAAYFATFRALNASLSAARRASAASIVFVGCRADRGTTTRTNRRVVVV